MSASKLNPAHCTVTRLNDYQAATSADASGRVRVVHDEPSRLFAHALVHGFVASHGAGGHVSLRDRCEFAGSEPTAPTRHLRSVGRPAV
ncbi:hypothetical protein GCM10027020_06440 [Nocardioides salsibiostraticola]